jgi:hypothetical protein
MCQMTASFARTRSYSLAVSLLAIAAIGTPGLAATAARPDFGYLDGRGTSDGTDADSIDDAWSAEALVENGWNFENPDSIPGFGSLAPSDAAAR